MAPLAVISLLFLSSAIGLDIGGHGPPGEMAVQVFTLYSAELISVLPVLWYSKRTTRNGYLPYALASMLALTMIGGYFTYKGAEVFKTQHPSGYDASAIRRAIMRGLVLCALEGAALGICFRAFAGLQPHGQSDLDALRDRFE